MATPSIEECREFLANPCEQPDGRTKSVLDHLSMLLLKIMENRPDNALNLFEQISSEVKTMPRGGEVDAPPGPCANAAWAAGLKELSGPPKEPAEGEEPEAVREIDGESLKMTNFVQEAAMFDAAGLGAGITRMNAVALFTGMRKLANKEPVKSVRLFGKILGMKRDYLICECEYSDDFEEPVEEEAAEPEGDEAEAAKGPPAVCRPAFAKKREDRNCLALALGY
jgi:radial spoke head protein 4A